MPLSEEERRIADLMCKKASLYTHEVEMVGRAALRLDAELVEMTKRAHEALGGPVREFDLLLSSERAARSEIVQLRRELAARDAELSKVKKREQLLLDALEESWVTIQCFAGQCWDSLDDIESAICAATGESVRQMTERFKKKHGRYMKNRATHADQREKLMQQNAEMRKMLDKAARQLCARCDMGHVPFWGDRGWEHGTDHVPGGEMFLPPEPCEAGPVQDIVAALLRPAATEVQE